LDKEHRTLVEFYDREQLENVVSLLHGVYSEVVYVYFLHADEPTRRDRERLETFVRARFGLQTRFLAVAEHSVLGALEQFRKLTAGGGGYDFDLTGGSSVFIAAAGALMAERKDGSIALHEYDVKSGRHLYRCPPGTEEVPAAETCQMTVSQVLALRGIPVLDKGRPIHYDLERDDLRGGILRLWETLRENLRAWNSFCTLQTNIEILPSGVKMEKRVNSNTERSCQQLLDILSRAGLVSRRERLEREGEIWISFRFHIPESACFLCSKGGNLLEMLTYLTAVDSGLTTDRCTGIELDWDGYVKRWGSNPFNELDVVMTVGHIPWFASCKSTAGENEYLYEIMTMTRHFGGAYAVPMLVSASRTNQSFRTRAKEMGIVLIDGVQKMTAEEFAGRMKQALER